MVRLAVLPSQANLGGKLHLIAQAAFGQCLADDLLGLAEAVDWRSVDQSHAAFYGGLDRRNRSGSSLPPHIQPPIAQVPRPIRDVVTPDLPIVICSMGLPLRI
jgi:hypothetical protein